MLGKGRACWPYRADPSRNGPISGRSPASDSEAGNPSPIEVNLDAHWDLISCPPQRTRMSISRLGESGFGSPHHYHRIFFTVLAHPHLSVRAQAQYANRNT